MKWPEARLRVLARDGYRCQRCGVQCAEVDHIWPRAFGGPDCLSNLRALCRSCNASKGDTIYREYLTWESAGWAHEHFQTKAREAAEEAEMWRLTANRLLEDFMWEHNGVEIKF